jgi:toxin YoeB
MNCLPESLHGLLAATVEPLQRRGDPAKGIGKPEALKNSPFDLWSRRFRQKDRLVYRGNEVCL